MQVLRTLKSSSFWFVLPSLVLITAMGASVCGYDPLSFDPSLYQTKAALAKEFEEVVPDEPDEPAQTKSVSTDAAPAKELRDGTYTGYAVCGQGNSQGWQPYYVAVTIEVKDAKVAGITDIRGSSTGGEGSAPLQWDAAESQQYLDRAIAGNGSDGVRAQMESQIQAQGSVASVDVVSGATFSSAAIYNAYIDAVAAAGGEEKSNDMVVPASAVQPAGSSQSQPVAVAPAYVAASSYADGDWTGFAVCGQGNDDGWAPYYVAVTVHVAGGSPTGITQIFGSATGDAGSAPLAWNPSESGRYLGWATSGRDGNRGLQAQINDQLASGGVSSVDTVSGATYSSAAIVEAYGAALSKAAAAAGSSAAVNMITPSTPTPSEGSGTKKPSSPTKPDEHKVDVGTDDPTTSEAGFADGTWTGYAVCGQNNEDDWPPYYVSATVTVKDGKVADVTDVKGTSKAEKGDPKLSWSEEDNKRYLDWATQGRTRGGVEYVGVLEQIKTALASGSSLGNVDVVSGATYSSNALVKACVSALKKSADAAGSTYEEPVDPGDKTADDGTDDDTGQDDEGDDVSGKDDDTSGDEAGSGDTTPSDGDGTDDGTGDGPNDGTDDDDTNDDGTGDDTTDDTSDDDGHETPAGPALVDGDYVGHALCEDPNYEDDWDPYYVLVGIRVENGTITQVVSARADDAGEVDPDVAFDKGNSAYFNRALNGNSRRAGIPTQIQAKLDAGEEPTGIDVVSGATFSSRALFEAYCDAVAQVPYA